LQAHRWFFFAVDTFLHGGRVCHGHWPRMASHGVGRNQADLRGKCSLTLLEQIFLIEFPLAMQELCEHVREASSNVRQNETATTKLSWPCPSAPWRLSTGSQESPWQGVGFCLRRHPSILPRRLRAVQGVACRNVSGAPLSTTNLQGAPLSAIDPLLGLRHKTSK